MMKFMTTEKQDLLQLARDLESKGKLEEAISVYNTAIDSYFDNADFYRHFGECLQKQGKHQEAVIYYQKAIEIQPKNAKAYHNLGNAFSQLNQWEEATNYYQKAIKINSNSPTSYYRLGEALEQQGLIQEAITAYQTSIQLKPDLNSKVYNHLGDLLDQKQLFEEAAQCYYRSFDIDPNFSVAYYKWKSTLSKINKLDEYFQSYTYQGKHKSNVSRSDITLLYILPVRGGGGGAHSVFQECLSLNELGIKAKIAVNYSNHLSFITNYSSTKNIEKIIVSYKSFRELKQICKEFMIVCATTFNSVKILDLIVRDFPGILPGYYIQDYEPLFYQKDQLEWLEARESYALIPHAVLFAKTQWLCEVVAKNHNVKVHKVEPSIDHQVYHPESSKKNYINHIKIAMMVRFPTPRRAPRRTLLVAKILSEIFPNRLKFTVFGTDQKLINSSGISLPNNTNIFGHLSREEVAKILRNSDIFLDLSDYQAFGRTALEAMACGCIPVVPERGGTGEFAVNQENSLVIDTISIENCVQKISRLIEFDDYEILRLKNNAIETASRYSNKKAASSVFDVLHDHFFAKT